MGGVNTIRRIHQRDLIGASPLGELARVAVPHCESPVLNIVEVLELRIQNRGVNLTRQIARPLIDPGVLVDLSPQETRAVRPLLANDFGSLCQRSVVDQQGATFATVHIFSVVKTLNRKCAKSAERARRCAHTEAVSVVFDDRDATFAGNR